MGCGNMFYHGTSTLDHHSDCRLIQNALCCVRLNVINVCWNDVGVLDLDGVVHVWLGGLQRVGALPWNVQSCWLRNEIFQSPNPTNQAREFRPCVNLHQEKRF